jgi:predicted O-methyltransferase YrrM
MTPTTNQRQPAALKRAPSPLSGQALEVVDRLHAQSKRQLFGGIVPVLRESVRARISDGTWDFTGTGSGKAVLADKMVALDPEKAALCHLLCRSLGAQRVVEIGTSYGVSTIYLADVVTKNEGDGTVIGTEHEPGKVSAARQNLDDAGVGDVVDILEGDLRETLPGRLDSLAEQAGTDRPVDFVLMDIWIPVALPALEILTPYLRPGALVVCDNVVAASKDYAEYLEVVRTDPSDGGEFESVTVPGQGGTEISMKV